MGGDQLRVGRRGRSGDAGAGSGRWRRRRRIRGRCFFVRGDRCDVPTHRGRQGPRRPSWSPTPGSPRFGTMSTCPVDLWRRILSVNLDGTFHCVWRAKDGMLGRGDGRIVCISSINGLAPSSIRTDRLIAYGTSKSAVHRVRAQLRDRVRSRHPRQLRRAGSDRHRHDEGHERRDAAADCREHTCAPDRHAGRHRRDHLLPAQRRRGVHHRPDLCRLGRPCHAALTPLGRPPAEARGHRGFSDVCEGVRPGALFTEDGVAFYSTKPNCEFLATPATWSKKTRMRSVFR